MLMVHRGMAFTLSGNYVDKMGRPIPDATIEVSRADAVLNTMITDSNGAFTFDSEDLSGLKDDMPVSFELNQNYPNPFNPSTQIKFRSLEPGNLVIYDILGRRIASQSFDKDKYTAVWGGVNDRGKLVSAGVYFYSMRTASKTITRKMVLLDKGDGSRLQISGGGNSRSGSLAKTAGMDSLQLSFTKEYVSNLILRVGISDNEDKDFGNIEGNLIPRFNTIRIDTCIMVGTSVKINLDSLTINDEASQYQIIGAGQVLADSLFTFDMDSDSVLDQYLAVTEVNSVFTDTLQIVITSALTDIDGNLYKTVKIGTQVWMAENLKVTHYRDGIAIPNVTDNSIWISITSGAMCYYNNDSGNAETYGALYNWYAVDDSRNIAPAGWHIPTDAEWTKLTDYLGGEYVAANKLKSTTGWNSNGNGTDEVAFCALPAGYRVSFYSSFYDVGSYADFWSATETNTSSAWYRSLDYSYDAIGRSYGSKQNGFSLRCIIGERPNSAPTASFEVTPGSGSVGTVFTFDASSSNDFEDELSQLKFRWDFESDGIWDVDWSSDSIVTHQYDTTGVFTVRLEVKDTKGDISVDSAVVMILESGTVTDFDGNVYKTVKIGNQWWMAENLRVTHYRDGTTIPNITDNTAWTELTSGAYCYYENDSISYADTYGALYNWFSVNGDTDGDGIKDAEIAPSGWHVPSEAEWKELEMYLGMNQSEANNYTYRGTDEGKKLKSTSGWENSGNGTDEVAFCALPAGIRSYADGSFLGMGGVAHFWSATEDNADLAWYRLLIYYNDAIYRFSDQPKLSGLSVRLLRD